MMRSRSVVSSLAIASLLAAVLAVGTPAVATSHPPTGGGTLVQLCYDDIGQKLNTSERLLCRAFQALVDSVASMCRLGGRDLSPAAEADCALVDGRRISEARISKFRRSWVHRALMLQNPLDRRAPLYEAQFPGTHNSFNASSYAVPRNGKPIQYFPSLTNQDPNQVYSITDQLRMGIRALEVDLHWVPSVYGDRSTGGYWVDVCHGQSTALPKTTASVHIGCTVDRSLQNTLAEIKAWVRAHPDQFLLIYLENQLDDKLQAHNIAGRLIRRSFGHLIARPPARLKAGHCASMPYRKTEAAMMGHGHRLLLVGNCGPGNAWNHLIFTRGPKWNEGGNPSTYGATDCAADRSAHEQHSVFRRWYEESPFLEAAMDATQVLTAKATKRMVRCGVNLTGFDQLMPGDGRLKAFVWSWAKGQPKAGGRCAEQGVAGRFRATPCAVPRHIACVDAHFDWHVTEATGPARQGPQLCAAEFPGSHFGVPPNGFRNWQVTRAKLHRARTVWLDYAKRHGKWQIDPRWHAVR